MKFVKTKVFRNLPGHPRTHQRLRRLALCNCRVHRYPPQMLLFPHRCGPRSSRPRPALLPPPMHPSIEDCHRRFGLGG